MDQDRENLQLLSIFYYIFAGFTALFSCFPVIHLSIGVMMLSGVMPMEPQAGPPIRLFGWLFVLIPILIILIGWGIAVAYFLAGRFLNQRRHYLYCQILAGITCMSFPFGTILGIFTIVVLSRPSVRALFEEAQVAAPE
jgi:hypothetical protein